MGDVSQKRNKTSWYLQAKRERKCTSFGLGEFCGLPSIGLIQVRRNLFFFHILRSLDTLIWWMTQLHRGSVSLRRDRTGWLYPAQGLLEELRKMTFVSRFTQAYLAHRKHALSGSYCGCHYYHCQQYIFILNWILKKYSEIQDQIVQQSWIQI